MTAVKIPKKKTGRPCGYNEKLADEICSAIACHARGIEYLCSQNPHWPTKPTIFFWLRKYPEFYQKYMIAKESQVEVSVDYMSEILNEPHKYIDSETGCERVDAAMLRLKIDAIKWQAGKLKPGRYGEKTQATVVTMNHEEALKHLK